MQDWLIKKILEEYSRDKAFTFSYEYLASLSYPELEQILDSVRYLVKHGEEV